MTKLKLICLFWFCVSIVKIQAQRNTQQAYDNWRSMRVGLFVHWGPSAGLGTAESHSHARKSALNPHGSIPAVVYDELYKKFNPIKYNPDTWLK